MTSVRTVEATYGPYLYWIQIADDDKTQERSEATRGRQNTWEQDIIKGHSDDRDLMTRDLICPVNQHLPVDPLSVFGGSNNAHLIKDLLICYD